LKLAVDIPHKRAPPNEWRDEEQDINKKKKEGGVKETFLFEGAAGAPLQGDLKKLYTCRNLLSRGGC